MQYGEKGGSGQVIAVGRKRKGHYPPSLCSEKWAEIANDCFYHIPSFILVWHIVGMLWLIGLSDNRFNEHQGPTMRHIHLIFICKTRLMESFWDTSIGTYRLPLSVRGFQQGLLRLIQSLPKNTKADFLQNGTAQKCYFLSATRKSMTFLNDLIISNILFLKIFITQQSVP